jgi:hypothetical protein
MAFTNVHPAPGVGELMNGFFVVPQNPITMAQTGIGYFPKMGDLLPGAFSVPQNPIVKNFASSMQGLGTMGCAPGTNCGGGFTGALAGVGMGELDLSQISTPSAWSTSTWAIVGVGALLLLSSIRPGRSQKRAEEASAKAAYLKRRADIKGRYSTVGARAYKRIAGAE